jgi:type IV pilus assembly protein PilE
MKRIRGFSLIELLTVVAIMGIIAAFAVPAYSDYVQRGKLTEGFQGLADFRVRMEQFYQDNRAYNCDSVTKPTSRYFTFTCTPAGASQTYTATATGTANGGMTGFEYTITQANAKASNLTASGWTNPATNNCWARRKDGTC